MSVDRDAKITGQQYKRFSEMSCLFSDEFLKSEFGTKHKIWQIYAIHTLWFALIFIGRTDAEAPILWPPDAKGSLIRNDPDAGKDWRQEKKGTIEDKMVGWHHWFDGHEFEQALGVGDGQGGLGCYSPWGRKKGIDDWVTEVNWTASWWRLLPVKNISTW